MSIDERHIVVVVGENVHVVDTRVSSPFIFNAIFQTKEEYTVGTLPKGATVRQIRHITDNQFVIITENQLLRYRITST